MPEPERSMDSQAPDWGESRAMIPAVMTRNEKKVRQEFWAKLARFAGHIPFAEDAVAAYYCALDTTTPLRVRALLLGALAYFIMPVDLVPDFIAGLGFTDDATVLATVLALVARHITPAHRRQAAKVLQRDGYGKD